METDIGLLVDGLRLRVVGSVTIFENKFPVLRTILNKSQHPTNDWTFFMTVAGMGTYFLTNRSNEEEAKEIAKRLSEINKQMPEAMDNFFGYINKNKETSVNLTITIGHWVLWNIIRGNPTHEECKELAPAIGTYLMKIISDFSK